MDRQATAVRRQQILDAAAPLFARRGFHGVSVDDLGAAAGMTGPALYRHFRAKEEILSELLLGVSHALLEGGRRRADGTTARRALEALVAWHVAFALDHPDVITVQSRELPNLPDNARRTVRSLQNRYVDLWASVVDRCTGCGRRAGTAAAHAAFGLMNSTPHSARLPRAEMASLLQAMAVASLLATPGEGDRHLPPRC